MVKVASTVPKSRFELFKAEFPADWEIVYLDYPIADDVLIAACQGADFLFVQINARRQQQCYFTDSFTQDDSR